MVKTNLWKFPFQIKWKEKYFETKFPYILILIILLCTLLLWVRFEKYIPLEYCDFERDYGKLYRTIYANRIRRVIERESNKSRFSLKQKAHEEARITNICPEIPDILSLELSDVAIADKSPPTARYDVTSGGTWYPRDCVARHHVAVIIPYRDRHKHLQDLLRTLIPTLQSQRLHFRIYVVEQHGNLTFNKGVLLNAGFIEALADNDWQCFVFHDVDLVSENNLTMYGCPVNPRHLSVAVDEMHYRLKYDDLVGGVFVIRREHFQQINGYSNKYWGWGSEDDDLAIRLRAAGLRIDRPPYHIARFKMFKHKKRENAPWKIRFGQLYMAHLRLHTDGLNSVQYSLVSRSLKPHYTHLMIDVGAPTDREPDMREQYAQAREMNSERKTNCSIEQQGLGL